MSQSAMQLPPPPPRSAFFAAWEFISLLFWASPTLLDIALLSTGTFFAVAGGTTYPILGTLYGKLIDDLNSGSCEGRELAADGVRTKVLFIAAVAVAQFLIIYIYMGCWTLFGERLVRRLRTRYLAALLRQDLAYFEQVPPGEISSRLDSDIQAIQDGASEKVAVVLTSVSYFVTAYGISFFLNAKLTALMSIIIPAYLLVGAVCSHLLTRYGQEVATMTDRATSIAAEGLSNIKLVQAYRAQYRLEVIYAGYLRQMQASAAVQTGIEALQMGLLYFVSYAANGLAIWWGSRDIALSLAHKLPGVTIGSVYTVIFVLVDASFVITRIAPHFKIFAGAIISSRNLAAVMSRESPLETIDPGEDIALRFIEQAVELKDVHFRYPSRPEQLVLDSVSFKIPAKSMTAIVGSSGSGKSTIASLIPRLYDFESGSICIDGCDIRHMDLQHLRSLTAVVEQSTALIQGSILENVAVGLLTSAKYSHLHKAIIDGRLQATVEAVRQGEELKGAAAADLDVQEIVRSVQEAVELAEASTFVNRLQHGLASDAGHNGRQLSGGQVQRLGIARALIKGAPILILDEATASLDSVTERDIQATIETNCADKTIICIAHRLSTIRNADKVIVLGQGKVLEEGTYAELLDQVGPFARMVQQHDMGGHSRASTVMSSSSLPLAVAKVDSALGRNDGSMTSNSETLVEHTLETTPLLATGVPVVNVMSEPEGAPLIQLLPRVLALARSQRKYLVAGAVSAVLAGTSAIINAVAFGNMVGSMSPCQRSEQIVLSGRLFGCVFLALAGYDLISTTARGASLGKFSHRVLLSSRILTFRSLFCQRISWHEANGRNPNTLLSYLTNDASSLSAMSGSLIGVCLSIIVSLGLGILVSHIIAWKIAVVLLSLMPLLLTSGFLRIRLMARFTEKHREAFANSVGVAKDAIDHIQTVALYSLEEYVLQKYERSLQEPYAQTLQLIATGNFWLALSFGLSSLVYAFAYWWGAYQVQQGEYSNTQFFIVLPALLVSAQQCGQLFTLAPDISRAGVAAKQIFKQIDIGPPGSSKSEPPEADQSIDPEAISPELERGPRLKTASGMSISFSGVSFSYPNRKKHRVLNDINIHIPADTLCSFTGPSGGGKSTLFSLMLDHYHPTEGQVLLNRRPLMSLPESYRDDIAIVPQQSVLFNASIEFNIAIGLPPGVQATRHEVEEVCKLANIHNVIAKLQDGYDTIVGGTGSGLLSGGQKQRIALARALIRKPRVLLLDEATSALDNESERIWKDSLESLMARQDRGGGMSWGRMTVVAIAHRLSTVRRAAKIFWIESGSCEFSGTHDELYRSCAGYRSTVDGQGFSAE